MVYGNNNSSVVTEDYLAGSKATHVIPSYASIDEMMYFVIESSEVDFNNIMMDTGIMELQHFEESGTEYVYEAGKIKEFADKIIGGFKSMWSKVQGMIEQAIKTLTEKAESFRRDVFTKIDQKMIGEKVNNLKADKLFATSYVFTDISAKSSKYLAALTSAEDTIHKDYDVALTAYKSDGASASQVESLEDKITATLKEASKTITGKSSDSASSVSKNIKASLRGSGKDWKGADVKANYKKMLDEVLKFPETKRDLKKGYEDLKKSYNKTISQIKKDSDAKFFEASIFSKAVKGYRSLKNLSTVVEQSTISVLNERYNLYRTIILKLAASRGKVKQESAMVSESSTSDAIDSLFNW